MKKSSRSGKMFDKGIMEYKVMQNLKSVSSDKSTFRQWHVKLLNAVNQVKKEYADLLRRADAIFIEELHANIDPHSGKSWYDLTSQAFTVFLPVKSVGVMGDERTYENAVALRAVSSTDGMTADWCHLPHSFLAKVSNEIINKVKGINRVVYDISSKPPATIEWE